MHTFQRLRVLSCCITTAVFVCPSTHFWAPSQTCGRLNEAVALLQAGLKDGQRDTRHHCPAVTAEGLPEDLPDPDADRKAAQEQNAAAKDAYEEGCFVKFEVQGDVPEAMPSGAALRTMLGGTAGGLAYVQYQPVRRRSSFHSASCDAMDCLLAGDQCVRIRRRLANRRLVFHVCPGPIADIVCSRRMVTGKLACCASTPRRTLTPAWRELMRQVSAHSSWRMKLAL